MDTTRDFTSGPIVGPLIRFSLPILAALFLQALYGAVDLLVVGKYAATADVSGVAVGSQIMMTVTGLISSLAMGSTILLGQKLGMRAEKDCGSVIGVSIAFFGLVGLVLTLLLPVLSAVLAGLMNAPEEAFRETRQYIAICGGGSLAIVAYNVLGSVMRGLGDSRTPLMTVAIACAVNIAGDLLLVAVFHLGAAGAAIATVAAQLISVLVSFLVLRGRGLPFPFFRRDIRLDGRFLRPMLRFGAPIALQDVLVSLSFLVILSIANSLGLAASAGVGVAEKVCGFIMLTPSAFMQAMSAYTAICSAAFLPGTRASFSQERIISKPTPSTACSPVSCSASSAFTTASATPVLFRCRVWRQPFWCASPWRFSCAASSARSSASAWACRWQPCSRFLPALFSSGI